MRERLLNQLETEDLSRARYGGGMSVLAISADSAMVQRVFAKLCELREIIVGDPDARHEFEWAIEIQLEDLFRMFPVKVAVEGLAEQLSREVEPIALAVICGLFSRVGRDSSDLRSELDDNLRQSLRTYLQKGVPVTLGEEDYSGSLKADLASALARVGEPEDLAILGELIKADIERVRRGREVRAKGDRGRLGNGGSMSYVSWHTRAVAQLDPQTGDTLLLDVLKEPEYERDAAGVLVELARTSKIEGPFFQKTDYDEIWRARGRRTPAGFNEERRKRYADASGAVSKAFSTRERGVERITTTGSKG